MEKAATKYNNMAKQKLWKQTDSRDDTILVLTTLAHQIQKERGGSTAGQGSGISTYAGTVVGGDTKTHVAGSSTKFALKPWRIENKGQTKIFDGMTWHQYPHQKTVDVYDGIYVNYKSKDHDAWVNHKKNWGEIKTPGATSSAGSQSSMADQKLGLSSDLKAVMVANFQCTQEEADRLRSDDVQNNTLNQRVRVI